MNRAEYKRAWSQRRYERRQKDGLCPRCGKNEVAPWRVCDDCQDSMRDHARQRRFAEGEAWLEAVKEMFAGISLTAEGFVNEAGETVEIELPPLRRNSND